MIEEQIEKLKTLQESYDGLANTVENQLPALADKIDNIDLTPIENKVDEGVSTLSTKIDNIDLSSVAKQGENQEATNSKILEEVGRVKDTFDSLDIPISAISGLALELESGKTNIVSAIKFRGEEANTSESLTSLASKVYNIKNPVAVTVPASTSNTLANEIFNVMMRSQGYDQMYETVRATYCGEEGMYVGLLMTSLLRGTNTSIQLTGADAYYILEEDTFYKTGENGNLIQFLNGIETQLTTKSHLWDVNNLGAIRTVFYLYVQDSTADGIRESTHESYFDYCNNTIIPYYRYNSKSGKFIHIHIANPDTCVVMWDGGSNSGNGTRYLYSNVYNITQTLQPYATYANMMFFDLPELRKVDMSANLAVIRNNILKDFDFSRLEEAYGIVINGMFVFQSYSKNTLSLPSLKKLGAQLFKASDRDEFTVELPSADEITNNPVPFKIQNLTLKIKNGCRIRTVSGTTTPFHDNVHVICEELYTTHVSGNAYSDFNANNNLTFAGIKKCDIAMGGTASHTNYAQYLYVNCIGGREDLIRFRYTVNRPSISCTDVEISEGTRQPLTFLYFYYLTPENIVNHIFNKLADNSYEDDGVTPAPAITITFGSDTLKTLTDEQKAIATNKNYILA